MPILKNAQKALRVSQRRQMVNRRVKTRVKTHLDRVKGSRQATDVPAAFSAIDKAVKKKLIHRNKAARLKSQVAKLVTPAKK
jgi:small subunit ribosomal protein S20